MGNENAQCREPMIKSFNSCPGMAWHGNTNIVGFLRGLDVSLETSGDQTVMESGKPDGFLSWSRRMYGGEGKTWIDFKAGKKEAPWRIDLKEWRPNQVTWYEKYAVPTGTHMLIPVWLYPEKRLSFFQKTKAHIYLIPASVWLTTKAQLNTLGMESIACLPEVEMPSRQAYTAQDLWGKYRISYDDKAKRYRLPNYLFNEIEAEEVWIQLSQSNPQ